MVKKVDVALIDENADSGSRSVRKPLGRPRGSKNKIKRDGLTESEHLALEEGRRIVQADLKLSATQVVNRAQIKTAVAGGTNAQKAHLERVAKLEQKQSDAVDNLLVGWEIYVRGAEIDLEFIAPENREKFERALLPHPADVDVDFVKRVVNINGPATTSERRQWAASLAALARIRRNLLEMRIQIEADPTDRGLVYVYTKVIDKYLTAVEAYPERYQPERLPLWEARRTMKFYWHADDSVEPPNETVQRSNQSTRRLAQGR